MSLNDYCILHPFMLSSSIAPVINLKDTELKSEENLQKLPSPSIGQKIRLVPSRLGDYNKYKKKDILLNTTKE